MLNWIWFGMMILSVVCALIFGRLDAVTKGALDAAEASVMKVMLPQIGFLAVWMGIMRLVEKSGMILIISRALSPVLRFLFPGIPSGHPALGAIAMNLGASMLGAGNAATPAGLRAMAHMQSLNPHKHVATNEMCMLLAMSTAVITLIPASTIRLLHTAGSTRETAVVLPAFLTTLCATVVAVLACKLLQRFTVYTPQIGDEAEAKAAEALAAQSAVTEETMADSKLALWQIVLLGLFLLLPLTFCGMYVFAPQKMHQLHLWFLQISPSVDPLAPAQPEAALFDPLPLGHFHRFGTFISALTIPLFMGYFVLHAAFKKVRVFEELVDGAKDGVQVVFRVIPYVAGILVAIRMLRESGALKLIEYVLHSPMTLLHFPEKLLPMAIIRPLSGGAAQGVLADIAKDSGPDDIVTMMAGTINGSADTTFYIAAIYFGSVGIKRMRHAITAGLLADLAVMIFAVMFCNWLLR
jgi:spore maturation protein SpmA